VPLVLAIEPDLRQAAIVKRIVREKALADVAVVDSRDAALEAMRTTIPDVLLLSALMSPREEAELIAHLRTLEHADHLQTHTIPQLASVLGRAEARGSRGLLAAFRRKKEPETTPTGCDPDIFAEEIRSYLQRAAEKKRERLEGLGKTDPKDHTWRAASHAERVTEALAEPPAAGESTSSWSSPFEWKPSANPSSFIADPESPILDPESLIAAPESLMAHLRPPAGIAAVEDMVIAAELEDPVLAAAPVTVAIEEPLSIQQAAPIKETAPSHDSPVPDSRVQDSRRGIRDSGLGIRDQRSAIRDARLGALASWARAEHRQRNAAEETDYLRGLLTGLAVPSSVVAVGYGRGCRIRRVRVPAAREPHEAEAVGAVILSKRLLAEQRERREQPQA